MLTERDLAILHFIGQFGFCEMPHLNYQFRLRRPRNYEIMGKLIREGYLIHERTRLRQHGIYRLTAKGALLTGLPELRKIPEGIYHHEIMLIRLYFGLMSRYPQAIWISERFLRWERCQEGLEKGIHIPDGILVLGEKKIGIELELTRKPRGRVEKILRNYRKETDIGEIWYFCEDSVIPLLKAFAENRSYLHIFRLREFVNAAT